MSDKQPRGDRGERALAMLERRRWPALALVLLYGAAAQVAVLDEAWSRNVFARQTIGDAAYYWTWAERIARGQWVSDHPFLAAPLYPYCVAALRALDASLLVLYAAQAALWLASATLTGLAAGRLLRPAALPLGAALFVLLRDPAYMTGRALNATLQVFFVSLLAWELSGWQRPSRTSAALRLGVVLGLGVVANPALLALVPIVGLWIVGARRGLAREWKSAAACAGMALVCVLPATLHNWRASGEWITVASHGGVTFAHGNSARADGTYCPVEGVSALGAQQDLDLRRTAARALGRPVTWSEADGYFMRLGLQFWSTDPARALALTARKAWWFCSGRNYGESYVPALEVEAGLADALALAPLPVAWLVAPGLLGLLLLARRDPRCWPLALAALGVAATNVVFFYSPRYRLPAVPLLVIGSLHLASYALVRKTRPAARLAVAASFALSIAAGPLQERAGFDRLEPLRPMFASNLGTALFAARDFERAEPALREAVEAGVGHARAPLAEILRARGELDGAIELLQRGSGPAREDPFARRTLGIAMAQAGRTAQARRVLEDLVEDYPSDAVALGALGNVALAQQQPEQALSHFDRALQIDDRAADVHFNRGVAALALGRGGEALGEWRRALELDPRLAAARFQLLDAAVAQARWSEALSLASDGRALAPDDPWLACRTAWLLATLPDAALRDGEAALALAREVERALGDGEPEVLDTLAAALAELGRFAEAATTADQATALLRASGAHEPASEIEARATLYRSQRPYRLPAPPP